MKKEFFKSNVIGGMKLEMKKILVVGSLNMDVVLETPRMPQMGETIAGKNISFIPGGKGANQAYAIGKLGGNVAMIGAVGVDESGSILKRNLQSAGVEVDGIESITEVPTGQAYIMVDEEGDNSIILIAGTNGLVTEDMIKRHIDIVKNCDIIVMQMEIPVEVICYVKKLAKEMGKVVIIDPAPAKADFPQELWEDVDYIKPNETELGILTDMVIDSVEVAKIGARKMLEKGVQHVLVSMGSEGCLFVSKNEEIFYPANKVKAVDTTAAGDSFTAAFALALSQDKSYEEAVYFGQKVAAVVVTRKGAQTSIPTIEEVKF